MNCLIVSVNINKPYIIYSNVLITKILRLVILELKFIGDFV